MIQERELSGTFDLSHIRFPFGPGFRILLSGNLSNLSFSLSTSSILEALQGKQIGDEQYPETRKKLRIVKNIPSPLTAGWELIFKKDLAGD